MDILVEVAASSFSNNIRLLGSGILFWAMLVVYDMD